MTLAAAVEPHVPFAGLATADLAVDAVYAGGSNGHSGDDPIARLIKGVGNQGGFRYKGSPAKQTVRLAVLYTTGADVDWPDQLDLDTGTFTYYGDNKKPGQDLHGTSRGGNVLLRDVFAASHGTETDRLIGVPPFLLFEKASSTGRAVRFRGLLAPGGPALSPDDELAAIWRATSGERFQNYRARFTERFQRCLSRVRTALAMTVMRFGLMRDLRKICQDFSRAMPRSTGARAAARARLTVRWVRVSSPPGGRLSPVVTQGPAPV
jgi:hypothetical protein